MVSIGVILARQIRVHKLPEVGSLWRHHGGGLYMIRGHAVSESTREYLVLYESCSIQQQTGYPWARPLTQWYSIVQGGSSRFTRESGISKLSK